MGSPSARTVHVWRCGASSNCKQQCGETFFILDARRVLAPAPTVKVPGSDIKTHLRSKFWLQAIWKKRGAILEFEYRVLYMFIYIYIYIYTFENRVPLLKLWVVFHVGAMHHAYVIMAFGCLHPVITHDFISYTIISNILRYLYERTNLCPENTQALIKVKRWRTFRLMVWCMVTMPLVTVP